MELRIALSDPVEIRLAVEFMGKIAVHRDQEGCFMATAATKIVAEPKPEPKANPSPEPNPEPKPESVEEINPADIQALASAKAKTAGASAVKELIAKFGASAIKNLSKDTLPQLKAELEAL